MVLYCVFLCVAGACDNGWGLDSENDTNNEDDRDSFAECESLTIEYDLSGSQFDIRNTPLGAGDATNDIGPGRVQIRFIANGGEKVDGAVSLIEYSNVMKFAVSNVETDMLATAGPDECGAAKGEFQNNVIEWGTPLRDYHSRGEVTCNAGSLVCGLANLPDGEPVTRDKTTDQALKDFQFLDDGRFTMDWVEIPNDDAGDTFLRLEGAEMIIICASEPDCPGDDA